MSSPSEDQIAHALHYDRAQPYDAEQIATIQRVTGATPVDGKWGPHTVRAVYAWQAAQGLDADGKVGPNTWAAIEKAASTAPTPESQPVRGCWIDDSPSALLTESRMDALQGMGLRTLAVMLNRAAVDTDDPWTPRWTTQQLEQLASLASARGMALVGTVWPLPDRVAIDALLAAVPPLLAAAGAKALEVDAEGNWTDKHRRGFDSMDDAAKALAEGMRRVAEPLGARLELTTYPYHAENGPHATLAPRMDRLFPQAYSVRTRDHREIPFTGDSLSPGSMQDVALKRARQVPGVAEGRVELGCGLAAYHQSWPGHTTAEAMGVAFGEAAKLGVGEVRYWSSTWLEREPPVAEFLRSLGPQDSGA